MTSLNIAPISATSTGLTTATTAYTDGDILGAEMSWDMGTNTYAFITGAVLHDAADIIGAVDLLISDRSVTFGSDNGTPSISDADNLFLLPPLQFPYPIDLGGNRLAAVDSLALPVKANASGIIYGRLITRSGHTFFGAVGNLQVDLYFSNDV